MTPSVSARIGPLPVRSSEDNDLLPQGVSTTGVTNEEIFEYLRALGKESSDDHDVDVDAIR
jgi:hypothetical protein